MIKKLLTSIILTIIVGVGYGQYCLPTYTNGCTSGDFINDFTFNTISNLGTGCASPSVNNYTDYTAISTNVTQGTAYTVSVAPGATWDQYFAVFIDFNNDFDFDDPGEYFDVGYAAPGATISNTINIPTGLTSGAKRLRVVCRYANNVINAGEACANFSFGETEDYIVNISSPYCLPTYTNGCTSGDFINDFTFNTISNLGTGCASPSVNNYTDYTAISTNVTQGTAYTVSVAPGATWDQYFAVFIDFNNDFDFDDPGEYFDVGYAAPGATISNTINIPTGLTSGAKRLRVVCRYANNVINAGEACANFSFGETEDYTVNISASIPIAWTGTTDTDWNTSSNWSTGTLPTVSDIVTIPDVSGASNNFPVISSAATLGQTIVDAGASLIINTGITLNETFTNNGTVTLKDGAYLDDFSSGTGSYVGTITVETIAANGLGNDQRLVSSPVNNPAFSEIADDLLGPWGAGAQGVNGVAVTVDDCNTPTLTAGSNYGNLFEFDESLVSSCALDGWVVRSSGNLENGRGYSAYLSTGTTFDFTGTPNSGDIPLSGVTNSGSGITDGEGWNLVGNPYPSPIQRDLIINAGASDLQYFETSGVYQGTYTPYLPTANIAIAQGIQLKVPNSGLICQNPIGDVSNGFTTNGATITSNIPNGYNFNLDAFGGATGTNISDGGGDMYDGGNFLNTNLGTAISYTDGVISTSPAFGGGSYFTDKIDNMFIMVADLNGVSSFEITGNNGADGSGTADGFSYSVSIGCETYDVFVKQVHSAFDPSINHIIIVPSGSGATQSFPTNTDDDLHTISGLTGVDRLYYLLVAGDNGVGSGYDYTTAEIENIVTDFVTLSDVNEGGLTANTLNFDNAMRTTGAATWYQNESWFTHKLEVSVAGSQFADKTILFYNNEATSGYEAMYDVTKRKSNAGKPTLSTTGAGKDLSLNGKSVNELGEVVPMNLLSGADGSFTMSFEGAETFPANTTIYVKDLQENILHSVADGDYTFVSNTADNAERFEIIFIPEVNFTTVNVDCDLNKGGLVLKTLNNTSDRTFEILDNNTVVNAGSLADLNTVELAEGNYTLKVLDQYGGSQSYDVEILNAELIEANFEVSNTEILLGEMISLNNTTTNSTDVNWTILNSDISDVNNLTYVFEEAGTYEVEMTVSNEECSDSKSVFITVLNKTTSIQSINGEEISVYPNPTSDVLHIDFNREISVKIIDFVGRTVIQTTNKSIDMSDVTSGIYLVEIYDLDNKLIVSEKIVKK